MFLRRLIQLAGVSLCLVASARSEENVWPFVVSRADDTGTAQWAQYAGPLFFTRHEPGVDVRGFRPLFLTTRTGDKEDTDLLYPFFNWRRQPGFSSFSFFQLVNRRADGVDAAANERFDVWPLYFSRRSPDPEKSYHALVPLGGTIKHRFSHDRLSFVLLPLYLQTEKSGLVVTHAPWPLLRFYRGPGYDGFEFWPLFGRNTHAGDYDRQFYLWPLVGKSVEHLSAPVPEVRLSVLPFYTLAKGPGYRSETYLWPFFGYTDRTQPTAYHERRYLWPFLVQGRGEQRYVNRWGPLYTHSITKGYDKTWFAWPLLRHAEWEANGLRQEKNQLLYFFYWSLEQHSLAHPEAAPARKTHLWPLFSAWDNGAGHVQVQALSPFEVFFQQNPKVRQLWTPLFALYQYERQPDTTVRHAFLWNAITWRRGPESREFHLGPLLAIRQETDAGRVAFGAGLFGFRRTAAGGRWQPFLFDFRMKAANKAGSASSP